MAYAAERHIPSFPKLKCRATRTPGFIVTRSSAPARAGSSYTMDYYGIQGLYGIDLYSPGRPGTMAFLEDVLAETMAIFPGKYIHVGGDEVVASGDTHWTTYTDDVTNFDHIFGFNPTSGSDTDIEITSIGFQPIFPRSSSPRAT